MRRSTHERPASLQANDRRMLVLGMMRTAAAARQDAEARVGASGPRDEPRTEEETMLRNGIDLNLLGEAVDAFRNDPETARITIRTRHRWDDAFAVDTRDGSIEDAGEITERSYTIRTDWPREVGGRDSGPSPGELLLAALGGCVGMTYITRAATRGVDIEELNVTIEARVDLQGAFELGSVRPGLARVSVTVGVRSNVDGAVLAALGETTARTSAVFDTLASPVPMELFVQRLPQPQRSTREVGA